jgi:hypothetical protein
VSTDYTNEIGYESLLSDFKRYQKQSPRGVGMARKGQYIYLQFKTPNTARKQYGCNCSFTLDGMVDALSKANKVAEKLKSVASEVEFWNWYDKTIKQESQLIDDRMTFGEAIIEVKRDFWNRPSRTGRERSRSNNSDQASWYRTYGCFYKHLSEFKTINLADILAVINKQKRGTRNYKYAVSAMKKLARTIKRQDLADELDNLNIVQTVFMELQNVDMNVFLAWRDEVLGLTSTKYNNEDIVERQSWLWAFSIQIVYGLRISEVFAIKNLFEPYKTKDGVFIPALNDPSNTTNLIYINDKTILGTSTKTGARIARPQIPPKYPNLMERLGIKTPLLPANRPTSDAFFTVTCFFPNTARKRLIKWNAPFTQTHADRSLGNLNGMQSGIPLEIRAQSMGHTSAMNDSTYKKRQSTQTTIDLLLNSNQNAIDFVTALAEAKKLVKTQPEYQNIIAQLLSIIYQKNHSEINELL